MNIALAIAAVLSGLFSIFLFSIPATPRTPRRMIGCFQVEAMPAGISGLTGPPFLIQPNESHLKGRTPAIPGRISGGHVIR